jgi:hypothetical protein
MEYIWKYGNGPGVSPGAIAVQEVSPGQYNGALILDKIENVL